MNKKDNNFDGNLIKKLRIVKYVGISIVVIIVLIQIIRILIFDLTAVNILQM